MSNIYESVLPGQDKSLSSFEAREIQEELFEKLSRVTTKRQFGALAGLTISSDSWVKSPEISNFIDFNRTTIGKGCNELCEIGLSDKKIAPGTENQNKPTLIFKLKPNIPITEVICFLKRKQVYNKFVYPEFFEEVSSILRSKEQLGERIQDYQQNTKPLNDSDLRFKSQTVADSTQREELLLGEIVNVEESKSLNPIQGNEMTISVSEPATNLTHLLSLENEMNYKNSDKVDFVNQPEQSSYTQAEKSDEQASDVDRFIEKLEELNECKIKVKRLEQEISEMGIKAQNFISPLWSKQN